MDCMILKKMVFLKYLTRNNQEDGYIPLFHQQDPLEQPSY